jgi:hypothetical protein
MNVVEFLAIAVLAVCAVIAIAVDRVFGSWRRGAEGRVLLAEQRMQEMLLRMSELERHNDELRQQLEWNRRLLEAQDRVLQQLGPGPSTPTTPPLQRV